MKKQKLTPHRQCRRFVVNPRSLTGWFNTLLTQAGTSWTNLGHIQPFGVDVDPSKFTNPQAFGLAYLQAEIFSKLDDGKPSQAKEDLTWSRFHAAEEMCRLTNLRLKHARGAGLNPRLYAWRAIMLAQQKMHALLGEFSWDDASTYFNWGPGASTRLPRRRSDAVYKYSGRPDSTIGNVVLANACIMRSPLWQEGLEFEEGAGYCNIVPGNRIVTVPKNYKTDRTIAIEPCMNMYVQKGIGGLMRRKLRRVGVDLDDQSRNQRMALIGSLAGTLATIDMSMASDTVSYEIVRLLLPPDWFEALEQSRSMFGILPSGERLRYQKFSSMGNGYTFELESAIFYCLASAVATLQRVDGSRICVYGDDVIVPTQMAHEFLEVISFCGFKPNEKKTFLDGPFRESCGKHFFSGYEVTPFYVKKPPKTLSDLFKLHNQFYRWCSRMSWMDLDGPFYRSLRDGLRHLAPVPWRRPRLPDGFGDGAFIGTFDEAAPRIAASHKDYYGFEGFLVRHLSDVSQTTEDEGKGRYLKALTNIRGPWAFGNEIQRDVGGGVSLAPRTREVTTLVPQFPTVDPFTVFGLH